VPLQIRFGQNSVMTDITVYTGLFLASFAAATILPMQSEAVLVGLLLADYSPWLLITVASVGNALGSVINWSLGRGIERFRDRPWFPASETKVERAQNWYRRYGKWSLLLSWVPIIGDPLTIIAGVLREPFPAFLVLVTIAKTGRYVVLTIATLGFA
tara:strand:- start:494 stop:964 length:471 start_codon:yes stop_codon:yes gene_type:complete